MAGTAGASFCARTVCTGCDRPSSVCLCTLLPSAPLQCPCEVVLLQHPKERRQKNRSAWIAERCIANVRTVVGRRLTDRESAPQGTSLIWDEPERCAVVFPSPDARPLEEVAGSVELLLFLDATWQFAQEMLRASPALDNVLKVVIVPPAGATPQFLVRKPLLLRKSGSPLPGAGTGDGRCSDPPEDPCAPPRWGFCTAEAVALARDAVCAARASGSSCSSAAKESGCASLPGPAWQAVGEVVRGHVAMQLARVQKVRHRPERPGYMPDLYQAYRASTPPPGAHPREKCGRGEVLAP